MYNGQHGMIRALVLTVLGCWLAIASVAQVKVIPPDGAGVVKIQNDRLSVIFRLKSGLLDIQDRDHRVLLHDGWFRLGGLTSKDSALGRSWHSEDVSDSIGTGKALTIGIRYPRHPEVLWQVTLYEGKEFMTFRMGIITGDASFAVRSFTPLHAPDVFPGVDHGDHYQVLDGNDGGNTTRVRTDPHVRSFNNLLVRFGAGQHPHILVAGGLTYHEFEKFVEVNRKKKNLELILTSEDPVGKRIEGNKTCWMDERYYLCLNNEDPFRALEQYGRVLKAAQHVRLNYYDFPTECLWYASYYNRDARRAKFNDTRGAVTEMKNAVASGITRYTRVAIRLVPDAYGPDNQQGWWDDAHWAMWGDGMSAAGANYVAPYLTTDSWCKAIRDMGGLPFTYFQSARRSEDFVRAHPDWMLFNDPYREKINPERVLLPMDVIGERLNGHAHYWWSDQTLWGYDFTDTGFQRHMKTVYARLKQAGIRGIMFDYPYNTSWAYEGGFDNPHATTAGTYREMFRLAYDGLGHDAYIHERNLLRGSDITLGLVSSQRVWGDNDVMTPEMVGRCGLRWYKNRVVLNYDMDAKDPDKAKPSGTVDGYRAMFTMCYVVSGRFLLGRSFSQLSPEILHAMSRVFPFPEHPAYFRPVDAFTSPDPWPRVYDHPINAAWHELVLYNYLDDTASRQDNRFSVALSESLNEGGLGLDSARSYYIYDFWNDHFCGRYAGTRRLMQTLRPGEARVLSIHAVENHPQFLSTTRHIMQGALDLKDCRWDSGTRTLAGTSRVTGTEPYRITLALNGYRLKKVRAEGATARVLPGEVPDLATIVLETSGNESVRWTAFFTH